MGVKSIHPKTHLGFVHYTVTDLEKQIAFYRDILGFKLLWRKGNEASLGTSQRELLRMTEKREAPIPGRTTGLYHTAFLTPTRWDLAHWVRQIVETETRIHGHSNHGTHLAIYLPDPEGNGIELAWDFPKEVWPMTGGVMRFEDMPRQGVDIPELMAELDRDPSPWPGVNDETVIGHVHLHVSDLSTARRFYHDVLGFDITADGTSIGAFFVSAGGYHHHIGFNVWRGEGVPPPPEGARGLRYFTVVLPDEKELHETISCVEVGGVSVEKTEEGYLLHDPARIGVMLTTRA